MVMLPADKKNYLSSLEKLLCIDKTSRCKSCLRHFSICESQKQLSAKLFSEMPWLDPIQSSLSDNSLESIACTAGFTTFYFYHLYQMRHDDVDLHLLKVTADTKIELVI